MAMRDQHKRPSRTTLVLLLLASFTILTLDARGGDDSPIDPVRSVAGDVFGPVEEATAAVVRPFQAVPEFFTTTGTLRRQVQQLEAENASLRGQVATGVVDRNRAAELDGLMRSSASTGYALVPARVIALGPAQSFSRTVTIDAGTTSGIHPDMTVLNNDGLVGRVIRADRGTATVLLVVDRESVVGGRLGSSMEVGFLRGRGEVGDRGRLDLDLVDNAVTPARDDVLVTWGSRERRAVRLGHPRRHRHLGVQQPPRAVEAGGDRPVRRLLVARPRRRRRRARHRERPHRDQGRRRGVGEPRSR